MATGSLSTVSKPLRMVEDFWCTSCLEQTLAKSADIYCETCLRFYCEKCVIPHSQLFTKHVTWGRGDMKKWPVPKEVEDFLRKCEVHEDKILTQFCKAHRHLCCSDCVVTIHSQCSKVTQISELINKESTDPQGLSVNLETVQGEIKRLQSSQEAGVQSLQRTYKEHGAFVIEQMRVNINTTIDECSNSSVSMSGLFKSVLSILNAFDNSTELNEINDDVISITGSITSSIHECTLLQNDLTQFYKTIQKIGDNKELCLIATIKCEHKIQQALTFLGKSGKVFTVQEQSHHNVRIPIKSSKCNICVLPDGQVLLADRNNTVKLLNQQYQEVYNCGVAAYPQGICRITPSKVAVAVDNKVQFITVTQSQLVRGRDFQLQHRCIGITHHQGDLLICSGTALYKYTLRGKLVCRLYDDASAELTVYMCAVSPSGDKLYIINLSYHALLTLARDGTLLARFTDPELYGPIGVDVTPAGQVLVCGRRSHTLLQVDSEGRRKLATLATRERNKVLFPVSVCYSSTTSSVIVGQWNSDNILVYRVE